MADTTPDITDTAQTVLTPFERNTLEKAEAWFEASFSGYDRAGAGTCPAPEGEKLLILCMTPRSGSTALSAALRSCKQRGLGGERLHRKPGKFHDLIFAEDNPVNPAEYLDAVIRRSRTKNGVGQIKCDYPQIFPFFADPGARERLRAARMVFLTRQDMLGQAISRFKGQQTGYWHSTQKAPSGAKARVEYDFDAIRKQVLFLANMTAAYERMFAVFGIDPLRITYEEVVADTPSVVARIGAHVGVELSQVVELSDGGHERIASTENDQLRARFLADISEAYRRA
ncbi:MAG: Stf0 family sulfotransferase [Roseovarius sp.]